MIYLENEGQDHGDCVELYIEAMQKNLNSAQLYSAYIRRTPVWLPWHTVKFKCLIRQYLGNGDNQRKMNWMNFRYFDIWKWNDSIALHDFDLLLKKVWDVSISDAVPANAKKCLKPLL